MKCQCGKIMAQWRDKCKSCSEKDHQERIRRDAKFISDTNEAINKGVIIETMAHGKTVSIKYLYWGVPGIWFVDNNNNHWCLSDGRRDIEKALTH